MIGVLCALLPLPAAQPPAPAAETVRLNRTRVNLRCIDYEFAVARTTRGIPVFDWQRFRAAPPRIVTRPRAAVILENEHLRATVIPGMGRLHSLIHRPSGKEQLWINPAAIPIPAHNDTGFWVTWGGIETVLPRGEHGTSHALKWQHKIEKQGSSAASVTMWSIEPLTGLKHTVTYRLAAGRPYLETAITVRNPASQSRRFSHWTTALLAPGGRGEATPRTEFIVPAARFAPADKPFNAWMKPLLGPTATSPLRFMESWKDIGDLMATPLRKPYYAAYSHETDTAVVRTLDLKHTPGFNIWTWGYPPSEARQKEYTAAPPNRGYAEFWNGTARDYTDAALATIKPGETLRWVERTWVLTNLRQKPDLRRAIERRCRL